MKQVAFGLVVTLILVSVIGIGAVSGVSYISKDIVLTFDDLEGGDADTPLPVGYEGLNWDPEWFYWDTDQDPYTPHSPDTRISSLNYGGWIDFSPLPKDIEFSGAWISGYNLTKIYFEGYHEGTSVGTSATLIPSETPTFLDANFGGPVDKVVVVGSAWNFFCIDDITYKEQVMIVDEDIKPGEDPNTFSRVSRDPLIVAIVGEEGLDAATIIPESIKIEGIAPMSCLTDDVCSLSGEAGKDGYYDMVMKFDSRTIARLSEIRHAAKGSKVPLTVTGKLADGTRFEGTDYVVITR
ncbi:MAG TPA: hypothetical protein PLU94_07685 [Methanoregulaceae archaeon]|nr:hypothetical protein [Methanoregulaceae archaeon]